MEEIDWRGHIRGAHAGFGELAGIEAVAREDLSEKEAQTVALQARQGRAIQVFLHGQRHRYLFLVSRRICALPPHVTVRRAYDPLRRNRIRGFDREGTAGRGRAPGASKSCRWTGGVANAVESRSDSVPS